VTGSSSDAAVLDQTGFYPLEKYRGGNAFRWSETAAAIRLRADAGCQSIRIHCVPARKLSEMDLRFYLDGKHIPDDAISTDVDDLEIRIDLPPTRMGQLGWICRPFRAKADPRHLGLPIMRVELASEAIQAAAADVDFAVASRTKSV
jgi:hypothetical protein